ncbi:MAG: polysaccharide deacetylase family protein [Candidatus Wildermuthbacteria bacterium]|nr:polysaccharide deacetylase family protein [Candidatus Wildermuthbacteria bacterium]
MNFFSKRIWLALGGCLFFFSAIPFFTHAENENLILNPELEIQGSSGNPQDWYKGRWGDNTASFYYPVPGLDGTYASSVAFAANTKGDAKWAFKDVPVIPGKEYEFSNWYKADVPTFITLQYQKQDGSFAYQDISFPQPTEEFANIQARFIVPPDVQSVTVFHLINQSGTLTVDNYSLKEIEIPEAPDNVIKNPSFEWQASSSMPQEWFKGRWGVNTALFTYPVSGHTGQKAAKVEMSQYVSGDAKWYFLEIPVSEKTYFAFSDFYRSDVKTYVTVQFKHTNGSYSYQDLGALAPSEQWQEFSMPFSTPNNAASFTVFHVIKGVGFLEVDDFTLAKVPQNPMKFAQGLVSLNFDDGSKSAYQNAIPILNQAGFKSDQFIVSAYTGQAFPAYANTQEMLAMQEQGHVIGAHTRTHADLTKLSPDEARAEIEGSRNDLLSMGADPVSSFAYPFGSYNETVKQIVKDAGFIAGRSSDGGYNEKTQDIFALKRQPMTNTTTLLQAKGYIDKALADFTWVILLFHEVSTTNNTYSITPSLFQEIVDYLKQKDVSPITVSQGIQLMRQ